MSNVQRRFLLVGFSFVREMEYAVDVQGFKQPGNDFVLKELAIAPLNDAGDPVVVLFKPPFAWKRLTTKYKRENLWLELAHHGLTWDSGEVEYTEIKNILQNSLRNAKIIYVVGEIKKEWLERFNFNVVDITHMGYGFFDRPRLVTDCTHHNGAYKATCALHTVKLMKQFSQIDSVMDWEDISVEEEYE